MFVVRGTYFFCGYGNPAEGIPLSFSSKFLLTLFIPNSFSYELSKHEGKIEAPEKPLSNLGPTVISCILDGNARRCVTWDEPVKWRSVNWRVHTYIRCDWHALYILSTSNTIYFAFLLILELTDWLLDKFLLWRELRHRPMLCTILWPQHK